MGGADEHEIHYGMLLNGGWIMQSGGIVYGAGSLEATEEELYSYMVMAKEEVGENLPHLSLLRNSSKFYVFHAFSQFQEVAKRELKRSQANNDDENNNVLMDDGEKFLVKFNVKLGNLVSYVSDNILPKVKKPTYFNANYKDRMEDGFLTEISANMTKARNMYDDLISDYDNLKCAKSFKKKSEKFELQEKVNSSN